MRPVLSSCLIALLVLAAAGLHAQEPKKLIPYSMLEDKKVAKGDIHVLVSERATKAEVMELGKALQATYKEKNKGKGFSVSIWDDKLAWKHAIVDNKPVEKELDLHWLVTISAKEVAWVAEGRKR